VILCAFAEGILLQRLRLQREARETYLLLVLGRSSTAEMLARRIISEFTAAGLNQRAIAALGCLTEALTANRASATLVTQVREYIVSLRTSPERDFAATCG
jgi:hypothetical protein